MNKQDQIQREIVQKTIKHFETHNHGYIDGAMRLGKIKITIDIFKDFGKAGTPIIVIAYPDNKIKDSWISEMHKWSYINPYITFVNFSSLHKWIHNDNIDFFIIDEFHDCSDRQRDYCHQIMTNNKDTKTLGLSGTVSKETQWLWGLPLIAKYSTLDGIKDNILSDYQITVHKVKLDTTVKTPNSKGKMLTEKQKYDNYSYVINQMKKDGKNYMHLALSRNRLSTSSLGKINAVKKLLQDLKEKRVIVFCGITDTADSLGIPSYHSKSTSDTSYVNFQEYRVNQLALAEMGKMGVSFNLLDSVILMNATSNPEATSQLLNRAIKLDYQGKVADLHVICLDEEPELKKIKESLSMLDKTKIKYI